jgi:hypothetical protein
MKHSPRSQRAGKGGFRYLGENLAWGSGITTSTRGVDMWYDEIKLTRGGLVSSFTSGTGHYTQVVWKETSDLGCATYGQLLVCQYGVGGNMGGQFTRNVNGVKKPSSQCPDGGGGGGGASPSPRPTPSRPSPSPKPTPSGGSWDAKPGYAIRSNSGNSVRSCPSQHGFRSQNTRSGPICIRQASSDLSQIGKQVCGSTPDCKGVVTALCRS